MTELAFGSPEVALLQECYSVTIHFNAIDYINSALLYEILYGPQGALWWRMSALYRPFWWMGGVQSWTPGFGGDP